MTLLIIFAVIKSIPPFLSWFIIDATISGDTKESCTGTGACWTYIKIWLNRFIYGMYPNELQWRINLSFIALIALAFVGLIPSGSLMYCPSSNYKGVKEFPKSDHLWISGNSLEDLL